MAVRFPGHSAPLVLSVLVCALLAFSFQSQELKHSTGVMNVEVPVRVFDGGKFVDTLKIDDFELLEDGRPQDILAVYLIKGHDVTRGESPAALASVPTVPPPVTKRHFILMFHMFEYMPELDTALGYLFNGVLRQGDSVELMTPEKTYRTTIADTRPESMRRAGEQAAGLLKKDLSLAGGEYYSIIRDLDMDIKNAVGYSPGDLAGNASGAPDLSLVISAYNRDLQKLDSFQTMDMGAIPRFAESVKRLDGSKHVFLFYQRVKVPQLNGQALQQLLNRDVNQEESQRIYDMATTLPRRFNDIDPDAIRKSFADASVDVHFLYLTKNRQDIAADVETQKSTTFENMNEVTGDVFNAFREIAAATGGTADSSANPAALLKAAAEATENYYVLYYSPKDYKADGKFREIKVRVKGKNYKVSNRAGYMAD